MLLYDKLYVLRCETPPDAEELQLRRALIDLGIVEEIDVAEHGPAIASQLVLFLAAMDGETASSLLEDIAAERQAAKGSASSWPTSTLYPTNDQGFRNSTDQHDSIYRAPWGYFLVHLRRCGCPHNLVLLGEAAGVCHAPNRVVRCHQLRSRDFSELRLLTGFAKRPAPATVGQCSVTSPASSMGVLRVGGGRRGRSTGRP